MLRSMYTAATAMLAQSRRMDVVTNNLTNVETNGYKGDTLVTRSFRDMLISRIQDPSVYQYQYVGPHNTGIHIDEVVTHFTQGPMEHTGVRTDMALVDDGFFVIDYTDEEGNEAERYTRSGNFNVDSEGYLVTPQGRYVLGQGGPIFVGNTEFTVNTTGEIIDRDGMEVDTLRVVRFENNGLLRKQGDNLFYNLDEEQNEMNDIVPEVKQTFLEGANVDTAREMVLMMELYRHYETNQRILRMLDDSLGRAVNDIARV